jgi:hypothetical protein
MSTRVDTSDEHLLKSTWTYGKLKIRRERSTSNPDDTAAYQLWYAGTGWRLGIRLERDPGAPRLRHWRPTRPS